MMADSPRTPSDYLKAPYCRVVIPDRQTGTYTARVMEFPGCVAQGDTISEAHERLERAAEDWIRAALDSGQDIPPPAEEQRYSGRILVRLPKSLHRRAAEAAETRTVSVEEIPDELAGVDIGPGAIEEFREALAGVKTVVWNGPMGVFEIDPYSRGTIEVARMLADATASGAVTVIGGGDSAAAVTKEGLEHRVSHVSTGGGASLEFLEGRELPGIAALSDRAR